MFMRARPPDGPDRRRSQAVRLRRTEVSGAPGRTRTNTPLRATDFESAASTISPLGQAPSGYAVGRRAARRGFAAFDTAMASSSPLEEAGMLELLFAAPLILAEAPTPAAPADTAAQAPAAPPAKPAKTKTNPNDIVCHSQM